MSIETLQTFVFLYPLTMSVVWMMGGLYFYYHWEHRGRWRHDDPLMGGHTPGVSILIPCHNEGENVHETMRWALAQRYPDFEVIAINDGSVDDTGLLLDAMVPEYERLRVVHLGTNRGKAAALRAGAAVSRHEILVCIDGDTLLDPHAVRWMVRHFASGPRVGAVTGNPRVRNRSTLLGRLQVAEFSSIIGLIKRAQRIYGSIFTVSGVIAAFRKSALQRVGFWRSDTVTEDIDVSWRLQQDHWAIRYEPHALCWTLMPETWRGLWRQRLRWAQGGAEAMLTYSMGMLRWRNRRFWLIVAEYAVSVIWSYTMVALFALWLLGKLVPLPLGLRVETLVPGWTGLVLGMLCLFQFGVSLWIDRRFERGLARYLYWTVWYPLAYWLINITTTVVAVPRAFGRRNHGRAVWVSPDRGVRT